MRVVESGKTKLTTNTLIKIQIETCEIQCVCAVCTWGLASPAVHMEIVFVFAYLL